MNNGQFAFRVWPSKQQHAPLASSISALGLNPVIHSRKAHRKSRGGCLACKKRRKKCDEGRPSCSRCSEKAIDCNYAGSTPSIPRARHVRPNTPPISMPLWPVARSPPVLTASNYIQHTSQDLLLIDNFVRNGGGLILGPDYSTVFTEQALKIAQEVPFLMHAMLALSACQLLHTVSDGRSYRVPEALHAQLASRGLRQAIGHMKSAKDMDSVFTSAMLLNCLAFCYADWRDDEPETQRTRPSWQWLRIQAGLRDLIIETHPFHSESMWMPLFIETNTFVITEPAQTDLDIRLAAFCDITSDSNEADNVYFEFHQQLAPLIVRPPNFRYLRLYSNAIGGIDQRFVKLLEQEDSRAMMLFAHWLSLMCSFVYWTTRRIRRECWLICRILDQRLVGEDRRLLERPAATCGYPLDVEKAVWPAHYMPVSVSQENNIRATIQSSSKSPVLGSRTN